MSSTHLTYEQTNNEEIHAAKLRDFERSPKLSEIRAVYKSRKRVGERPQIRDAKDAESYLRAVWNRRTLELNEEFIIICLNGNHQAIGWVKVSSGGFNASVVDPRLVFAIALQTASTALILAHNHPSGSTEPSEQDKAVTRQLTRGWEIPGHRGSRPCDSHQGLFVELR